jgi:hypothetical protein
VLIRGYMLTTVSVALLGGCIDDMVPAYPAIASSAPSTIVAPHLPADIFETLKGDDAMHAELCDADEEHPNFPADADTLTRVFCQDAAGGVVPTPTSLDELLVLLGLDFKDRAGGNGQGGNPGFALLGHSSALTARKVTTLTPTAFVFTPPPPDGSKPSGYVFLAFDPGETFVEVASHDPTTDEVNLYLVLFDKSCTATGCGTTDVLTPNLTKGWSHLRQYESSTSLNNTIADCRQCHAPDDSQPQILRMQEIEAPFTHWFSKQTDGGRALLADFHAGHPADEDYGPIPAAMIDASDPALMAQMITQAGFANQPNAFDSAQIEAEVMVSSKVQPMLNTPRGRSATWDATYMGGAAGQFIAAPYHDVKVTDPDRLAAASRAYLAWASGKTNGLPEIGDVFLDDALRDLSFAPQAGLDGRGLIVQLCSQCHNSRLDPTISRERFLVDQLDSMSRMEKDIAIMRLGMDPSTRLFMPPALFHTVTDDDKVAMIAELRK